MVEAKKVEFWRWPEESWVNPDIDWRKGKFITAGVDVGSVSSQAVIMVDGQLYAHSNTRTGSDSPDSARKCMNMALEKSDLKVDNIDHCIGTGYGRVNVPMAQQTITEIACHARGANFMYGPEIQTVLDMGGQDCKAIRCDNRGKVLKFMMNDKCAAGTGRFIEVIAETLQLGLDEIGEISLKSKNSAKISSTCTVFAEQEVVSCIAEGVPIEDIVAGIHDAIASRIYRMVERMKVEPDVVVTGGVAKNVGMIRALEAQIGFSVLVPEEPLLTGARGAALLGRDMVEKALQSGQPIERRR